MEAEEFGSLWQRGFPGWEEECENQGSDHAIQKLKIQLIRLWLDPWSCWRRDLNRVSMEPLAALRAVAADLRKFMSTGWADFHRGEFEMDAYVLVPSSRLHGTALSY